MNEAFLYKPRREERARYWNDMIRALPIPNRLSTLKSPALPDSKIQQPLSPDWRAMNQWAELQAYLPYIFLGDPSRYDRPRNP